MNEEHEYLKSKGGQGPDASLHSSLPPSKANATKRMMTREDSTLLHMLPTAHEEYADDALVDVEDEDDDLFHVDGKFS